MAALQHMGGILWLKQEEEEEEEEHPDMIEFSFSRPRKIFHPWDVDSCGVAQFNFTGVTE